MTTDERKEIHFMDMKKMMKQAQKMQQDMMQAQENVAKTEFSASSGGGMVTVTATGDMKITSLHIDPDAIDPDDIEMLEDMIIVAINDIYNKINTANNEAMSASMGGLNIPGLSGLF